MKAPKPRNKQPDLVRKSGPMKDRKRADKNGERKHKGEHHE